MKATNKILITGAAGFIGFHLSKRLISENIDVYGIDNLNDYYDTTLKDSRLEELQNISKKHKGDFYFTKLDLANRDDLHQYMAKNKFTVIINLAAQAGVRYSIENPSAYVDTNLVGFGNILEGCRHSNVGHLVYASSSSTYGLNTRQPYNVNEPVNHPLSLYAATKKANELMAHTYSHLFKLPTTGLRFFTVYGPYDRPDMALQKFARAIMSGETIQVFNHGNHKRDFTYIDDIVNGIIKVIKKPALPNIDWNSDKPDPSSSSAPYRIYNIGNSNPVNLKDYIFELEKNLKKEAIKQYLPIQPGDVPDTFADISSLIEEFDYRPTISVEEGIKRFSDWFLNHYNYIK